MRNRVHSVRDISWKRTGVLERSTWSYKSMLFFGVVPVGVRTDTGLFKRWQKRHWPQVSSALAPSQETLRERNSIVDGCHCLFVHLLQKSEFQPFLKWTYFCSRGLCKVSEQVRSSLTERMSALCQARSGWQNRKAERVRGEEGQSLRERTLVPCWEGESAVCMWCLCSNVCQEEHLLSPRLYPAS